MLPNIINLTIETSRSEVPTIYPMNNSDFIAFLPYWDIKNPTMDDKTQFIMEEAVAETECSHLGAEVYSNIDYKEKDPKDFIKDVIKKEHPRWVLGIENTATLLLPYMRQRKILINPSVKLTDLNWVTPETIRDTYAFFSSKYEKDYELFTRVYQNIAFYPDRKYLSIEDLSPIIKSIIEDPD